jgi:deazaflavin-dependent oxidoreductase (nitroreductase family)
MQMCARSNAWALASSSADRGTGFLPGEATRPGNIRASREVVARTGTGKAGIVSDWNSGVIEEFRANDGKVGGPFEGAPLLLLHTTGAKSGEHRISPLMYLADGDRYVVFASKGGHDFHPHWMLNIEANPAVELEVGTERFTARAEVLREGPERNTLYAEQVTRFPQFGTYEEKAARTIPVVVIERTA